MRFLTIQNKQFRMAVSKLVLGTNYFGTTISEEESFRLMDYYFSHGGNILDTARSYANWLPGGESASERTIAKWLKTVDRKKILLSTKGGLPDGINRVPKEPIRSRINRKDLYEDLCKSLDVLGTDYIDLYWLHRDDPSVPVSEIMELVNEWIKKGLVKQVGASNWNHVRLQEAQDYCNEHGLHGFSMSQIQWSLAISTPADWEDDTIVCMNTEEHAWYKKSRLPIMAFSSQAKGLFSKAISNGLESLNEKVQKRFLNDINLIRIERVRTLCQRYGVSPAAVCLSYILSNEVQGAAILGCSKLSQLKDSMASADFVISNEDIAFLTAK